MKVLIANGPNLGMLGSREPDVYGSSSFEELSDYCRQAAESLGLEVDIRQTDDEAELVGWLHEAARSRQSVILNPAAFTHYSYSLRDACAMLTAPLLEVHLTNPARREDFRHTSVVSAVAHGVISGFGVFSYILALQAIAAMQPTEA